MSGKLMPNPSASVANITHIDESLPNHWNFAIIASLSNLAVSQWKTLIVSLACFFEYLCLSLSCSQFLHSCIAAYASFLESKKTIVLGICCGIAVDLASIQLPSSNMKHKAEAFWCEFFGIQPILITSSG